MNRTLKHRVGSIVFGLVAGLAVAYWSYQWLISPGQIEERREQERVVLLARSHLLTTLALDDADIVDPLAPNRKIGKVYVFRSPDGWEVSGFYRRDAGDRWHAFLATVRGDDSLALLKIKDSDAALAIRAEADPRLEVLQ